MSELDKLIEMKRQLTPSDVKAAELKAKFTKRPADQKKFKGRMSRLKGMMTQWEPYQQMIDKYIAKKTTESKNLPEKIERLRKTLKAECAHPIDSLVMTEEHHEGDADTKGFTTYTVRCKLCGKTDLMETKVHNYL